MGALSLYTHLGIFWIQGLFTFCFLIFLLYREGFLVLTTWLFICEAHLAVAFFLLLRLFMTRIVNMRMYIFDATNLIKKLKERVHWLLYYKEAFILKAGTMQNGTHFQSRNNSFKCSAGNKRDKKMLWRPWFYPFFFQSCFKNAYV